MGSPRRSFASAERFAFGSGDVELLAAVEDAGLVRDAFGAVPPGGVPDVFLEPVERPLRAVLAATRRHTARSRPASWRIGSRSTPGRSERELEGLERDDELVRGELRPGGSEREWCDPDVLRRIRRATLAVLRREVEPAEQAAFGRFLPSWHGIGRRQSLREALVPLQGVSLPVFALGERRPSPPGARFRPADLDALCASG